MRGADIVIQHYIHVLLKVILRMVKSVKVKQVGLISLVLAVVYFFGIFAHLFEKNFYTEFHYPMDADITEQVMRLRARQKPSLAPINAYNYSFISNCEHKCGDERLQLVYIVKSAAENFARRRAIRNSWGFENRFSDVPIRTVFVLGVHQTPSEIQTSIDAEQLRYKDIVQANFLDTYFNNTIKTMTGFAWAVTYCPLARFYMFSDDDMYISTKNVLRFVRHPTGYPGYLEDPVASLGKSDFELADDVRLYAGYVFPSSPPHRGLTSKWAVPLSEYPYHLWPPYVTAMAYVVSHETLQDIYYASLYTKHFRFDDIFLGLVARKAGVEPYHCDEFYYYKRAYDVTGYRYVVASHGYDDPAELARVWSEQKEAGNA